MKKNFCRQELVLLGEALSNNPKSYGAWFHRRWLVELGFCELASEFRYVEGKLDEDQRNFHAWHYRQFLAKFADHSPEQELAFSEQKIEQNFSNYSAWHYRQICFEKLFAPIPKMTLTELMEKGAPLVSTQPSQVPLETLEQEFETVHSAFVTDPDDSSSWIYYRWLISKLLYLIQQADSNQDLLQKSLEQELDHFRNELLPINGNSKWTLLTYVLLVQVKATLDPSFTEEASDLLSKLMTLDPMRKGFYKELQKGKASILMDAI